MTALPPRPEDDLPRDPAFDESWRALSAEEPPPSIDAALRAAARREVEAGPRIAVADRAAATRAAKPMNWWRPLAVAATLGAIAVGLLQLVTPEHVNAPGHDAAVVSDTPPSKPADRAEPPKDRAPDAVTGAAPDAKETNAEPAAPAATAGDAMRKDAAPPAPAKVAPSPAAPVSSVAPRNVAEPFPADRSDRADTTAKRAAVAGKPAAAGAIAPSTAERVVEPPAARAPADDVRAAPAAMQKALPSTGTNESGAPARAAMRREQQAPPAPPAAAMLQGAAPASRADAQAGTHPPLSVPDWIALIRRLVAERNFAAAEAELADFRAAHADAQQLLPPDLRDWKAPR